RRVLFRSDLQGKVITEDFPEDHKHHRGIFWTWHQVVVNGQPMGDAWECKDFSWDVKDVIADQVGENLQLQIKTHWGSPHYKPNGQELPFVEEYTKITIRSEEHTSELQSRENLVCRL